MPVTLTTPAGSQTSDGYTEALTLGPSSQLESIQFTVGANTVLAQVYKRNRAGKPILDPTELPFAPGQWGLDKICGIRFRSAFAGAPGTVNVVGYYGDDAVPFGNASVLSSNPQNVWGGSYLAETIGRIGPVFTPVGVDLAPEAYLISGIPNELTAGETITGVVIYLSQTPTGAAPTHLKIILVDELTLTVAAIVEVSALLKTLSAPTFHKIPFASPYSVPKDGWYYCGYCSTGSYGGASASVEAFAGGLNADAASIAAGIFPRADNLLAFGAGLGNPGVGTVLPAGNPNSTKYWFGLY